MADIKGLKSQLQESENKFIITDSSTTAERLRAKIIQRKKSEDECLKLKQEIMDFFATNPSAEEKEILWAYTESLWMECSAIEIKRQVAPVQQK